MSNFNDTAMCPAICKLLVDVLAVTPLVCLSCQPTFATISESNTQAQVGPARKETVTGNVLIWFLCAASFLRVSQRINSFMASLGVNAGHTGGSMLAGAMIATKRLSIVRNAPSHHLGGGRSNSTHTNSVRGSKPGAVGAMDGLMSGGLVDVVSRSMQNKAVRAVTGSSRTGMPGGIGGVGKGSGGIDGQIFASSISKGGNSTNSVISSTTAGSTTASGSMTGEEAVQAPQSYMDYATSGEGAEHIPSLSNVETGGGRTTGTEISEEYPEGAALDMYYAVQYTTLSGGCTTIQTVDRAFWYKRYAADAIEKPPHIASDGSIAYNESIVRKLPPPPQRKDRI